jgi:hypothetical protein
MCMHDLDKAKILQTLLDPTWLRGACVSDVPRACHPTRLATHFARHPTRPVTPYGPPTYLHGVPTHTAHQHRPAKATFLKEAICRHKFDFQGIVATQEPTKFTHQKHFVNKTIYVYIARTFCHGNDVWFHISDVFTMKLNSSGTQGRKEV